MNKFTNTNSGNRLVMWGPVAQFAFDDTEMHQGCVQQGSEPTEGQDKQTEARSRYLGDACTLHYVQKLARDLTKIKLVCVV